MHRTGIAAILLATLTISAALAQTTTTPAAETVPQAAAAEGSVELLTVTCAQARREGAAVTPSMITSALAGRFAVAAGHSRLAPDYIQGISDALRRACVGAEANDRKLIDVAAGVAMADKSAKNRDFAVLTCTQLAPLWKDEARTMVPFLFALREGTATTPMTKAALDKIGGGVPKLCREPANAQRRVVDVLKDVK